MSGNSEIDCNRADGRRRALGRSEAQGTQSDLPALSGSPRLDKKRRRAGSVKFRVGSVRPGVLETPNPPELDIGPADPLRVAA